VIAIAWIALVCALLPALLYLWNSFLFREPPEIHECLSPVTNGHASAGRVSSLPEGSDSAGSRLAVRQSAARPAISVLIPARNEARGIAACVESILASRGVELEVIVLDDHSTDRTADIVRALAAVDSRLHLETAPALPDGWCGKQAACFTLSRLATHEFMTFLDADVRIEPNALARMILFQEKSGAALVSGFPRQETITLLEKSLIPLIHWLLLSFLPIWAMRRFRWSAFGAGCGQWFLTTRAAYDRVGGHGAIRSSLHDGLTLPRAYRRAGFMTDICDATSLATCRMYRSSREVWSGLAKNAREGLAATGQIGFWTALLLCGQVLPFVLIGICWDGHQVRKVAVCSIAVSCMVREAMNLRFGQSRIGVFLHLFAILLLLAIQWYAIYRAAIGKPVGWKGRGHPGTQSRPLHEVLTRRSFP
jgi:glycosyltransferase involved in cell wall biosynthesis